MRKENSHQSEMVSQVLYGELYKLIEKKKNWVKRKKSKLDNRIIKAYLTTKGQEITKIIEGQLDKIGFLIESEIDAGLRGEIIEAGISLNWAISKQLIAFEIFPIAIYKLPKFVDNKKLPGFNFKRSS